MKTYEIILLSIISILLWLLFSNISDNVNSRSVYNENTSMSTLNNSISRHNILTSINSSIETKRPVNVPLTPFKSSVRIHTKEKTPPFLLYKKKFLTPTEEQGVCGSCWAFSIMFMLGDRLKIKTNGAFNKSLSTQQLLECYNHMSGCVGENPEDALLWMGKTGKKIGVKDKYIQEFTDEIKGYCKNIYEGVVVLPESIHSITEWIEEVNPNKMILEKNIKNMKLELLVNGPFIAILTIYNDFYVYDGTSIYEHDKKMKKVGGHAVEIIGYCDENIDRRFSNSTTGYWICKHSWYLNWPLNSNNKGYFAIKMGTNECGIESRTIGADTMENIDLDELNNTRYYSYTDFFNTIKRYGNSTHFTD